MILVKNKWFPFGNYKAINICGIVFYKGDNLSDKTINHENGEELVKTLSVLNKGVKRISKAYACEHILHCSPATFDNYVRAGIIPKGKKEIGFNELSWSLKDFDGVKLQRIHKK